MPWANGSERGPATRRGSLAAWSAPRPGQRAGWRLAGKAAELSELTRPLGHDSSGERTALAGRSTQDREGSEDRLSSLRIGWILLAASGALCLGLLLKIPCLVGRWGPPEYLQYKTVCYNDLQPLYGLRGLDLRELPYLQNKSYEYPVLIGMEMWIASLFARSHVSFFLANLPFLGIAALAAAWCLGVALGPSRKRALYFAAAPSLVFYAFHNWDLLAVAPVVAAVLAWSRGRAGIAGAALGLGAAAKLYPAFGVPVLAAWLMWAQGSQRGRSKLGDPKYPRDPGGQASRGEGRRVGTTRWEASAGPRTAAAVLLGAAAGWAALNVPVVLLETLAEGVPRGWLAVFQFHARRTPDFGTVWYWWADHASAPGRSALSRAVLYAGAGSSVVSMLAWSWSWVRRRGSGSPQAREDDCPMDEQATAEHPAAGRGVENSTADRMGADRWVVHSGADQSVDWPRFRIGWIGVRGRAAAIAVGLAAVATGAGAAAVGVVGPARFGPTSTEFRRFVDVASLALLALGFGSLLYAQRAVRRDPWCSFAAAVCLFLSVSKVHSPQYALWLTVFFAVCSTPWQLVAWYFAADALLLVSGFWWFATSPTLQANGWRAIFVTAVFMRAGALAALGLWYAAGGADLVPFGHNGGRLESRGRTAGSPTALAAGALDGGGLS